MPCCGCEGRGRRGDLTGEAPSGAMVMAMPRDAHKHKPPLCDAVWGLAASAASATTSCYSACGRAGRCWQHWGRHSSAPPGVIPYSKQTLDSFGPRPRRCRPLEKTPLLEPAGATRGVARRSGPTCAAWRRRFYLAGRLAAPQRASALPPSPPLSVPCRPCRPCSRPVPVSQCTGTRRAGRVWSEWVRSAAARVRARHRIAECGAASMRVSAAVQQCVVSE